MEYKCSVCKKKHEMYFGISAEMSPRLGEIIKEDPSRVFEAEKGMFLLDKSYAIIPSMIEIKTDFQIPIWYETWVKIEWEKFYTMSQSYKNSIGAKIEGELFDDLVPLYKNSIGTKCEIIFAQI